MTPPAGSDLVSAVADELGVGVVAASSVGGGDINDAYQLHLDDGTTVFVKTHPRALPGMFRSEAAGLRWLAETATVRVPTVLAVRDDVEDPRARRAPEKLGKRDRASEYDEEHRGDANEHERERGDGGDGRGDGERDDGDGERDRDDGEGDGERDDGDGVCRFLALEWIEQPARDTMPRDGADPDEVLGRGLAALHRAPCDAFGLDHDNHLATIPQDNRPCATWSEFFVTRRLEPMARAAIDTGRLPAGASATFGRLFARMDELAGPPEPPSRLHGDLWGGNAIAGPGGQRWLIDPATYGGHREIDLAMMRLFGGFGPRVFAAYEDASPLADGHEDRLSLYQLVPLLAHALLFGGGYGQQALVATRRYVA